MKKKASADLWLQLGKLSMLIAAHDQWIRDSLVYYFESIGCRTASFISGQEAQEALSQKAYDIIVADYALSDMLGLEFLLQIHPTHPRILKILITAGDSKEISTKAERMGFQIIEKPFTTDTIDDAFIAYLKEQQRLATEQ
ncbi:MAG: response regulator [Deltaproteobacteria bacterium]|nr:response regulator [Deltaproteobacteria bacterium]